MAALAGKHDFVVTQNFDSGHLELQQRYGISQPLYILTENNRSSHSAASLIGPSSSMV